MVFDVPATKGDAPLRETRWRNCGAVRGLGWAPICFCETNPPFFWGSCDVTIFQCVCCGGESLENSVGSFWKTNPILRGFWWVRRRESSISGAFSTGFTTFINAAMDKARAVIPVKECRLAAVRFCPLRLTLGDELVELFLLIRPQDGAHFGLGTGEKFF